MLVKSLPLSIFLVLIGSLSGSRATALEPIVADHAMVVSASELASQAGADIMREGGNAFDAAATVGFVLAVSYPPAGNIGGGGFLVAYTEGGEALSLDFREMAPRAAHRDMFLDEDGDVVSGMSLRSGAASGVPGSVDGLLRIWEDHGSGAISRKELLGPAIRLAEEGFPISRGLANALNSHRALFSQHDGSSAVFNRNDGEHWKAGDLLVQKDLAKTLRRIARHGRTGFYEGPVAQAFAEEMARKGGFISREDLAQYQSRYRAPVRGTYHDVEIISMGPPSSGGIFLIQMLNMLESYDLNALGWGSSAYVHLLTEVERRAYADRAEHLGDPDFWAVPIDGLIRKDYARARMHNFDLHKATPSSEVYSGKPPGYESTETTHYSIVDPQGNAVSVTTTLNTAFGSGIVVEGAGFLLNNEMDDFSAKPGVPNTYGLVGKEANAVAPGKRMLSSMTPTVVVKNGKAYMALGSPGGSTIITTTMQVLLNVHAHGMNIREAVSAPRHHAQWLPDVVFWEPRALSRDVEDALSVYGHALKPYYATYIGQANCISMGKDGIRGAPDPRGENAATGF